MNIKSDKLEQKYQRRRLIQKEKPHQYSDEVFLLSQVSIFNQPTPSSPAPAPPY